MSAVDETPAATPEPAPPPPGPEVIQRHALTVRVTHWINLLAILVLLLSGLQIFNAHPELYWGKYGADFDASFIALKATNGPDHLHGTTRIGDLSLDTTGLFGASKRMGAWEARGFPAWLTIPTYRDLATGRRWHFFFAWLFALNGLAYLLYGFWSGHFGRDIKPTRDQLRPRNILQDVIDHLKLRHPTGEAAKSYNFLQKAAYMAVIFVFLPLMVLTGLAMSPGVDAAAPWLVDLFFGRQTARTLHFLSASAIVLFVFVHVAEVILVGPINEIRSMITGRYVVPQPHAPKVKP